MGRENKNRAVLLAIIFIVLIVPFFVIIGKVIYLETAENSFWENRAKEWNISEHKINARRGDIYSKDSETGELLLLATSLRSYDVYLDLGKGKIKEKGGRSVVDWIVPQDVYEKGIHSLCDSMARVFGDKASKDYLKYFKENRKKGNRYVLIKKDIDEVLLERIKYWPILGKHRIRKHKNGNDTIYSLSNAIATEQHYNRVYPYGDLARRTIGVQGIELKGKKGNKVFCDTCFDGIDGYYSKVLSGKHGYRWERRINPNQWVPIDKEQKIKVEDGQDVISTIDVSLQELAQMTLLKCLDSNKAERGTVILMETKTGHIKALANYTLQEDGSYREIENIGVSSRFEPGSTFKIVTAMMLLDKGLADTSNIVPTGSKHYPNTIKDIRDVGKVNHGDVSFTRALEMSSNVGISSLVYDIYCKNYKKRSQLRKDLSQYFNYNKLGLDLALDEPIPKILETVQLDDLLRMSFGYVTAMTPLQMLTFYNAIANNGVMVKPMFVSAIAKEGKIVEEINPTVISKQICKPQTLKKIQDVLKRVVLYGTGKRLRNTSYGIAGKSGTAEIGYDKKSQILQHRASFVGYFPAESPEYSCIVVISKPQKALTHGGDLAAPVFKELSDRVIGTSKVSYEQKGSQKKKVAPTLHYGNAEDYKALCKNLGVNAPYTSAKWIRASLRDSIVIYREEKVNSNIMPNVTGLSIKDAVFMLENMGLRASFSGFGRVVSQSIPKGQRFSKGQQVVLKLEIRD